MGDFPKVIKSGSSYVLSKGNIRDRGTEVIEFGEAQRIESTHFYCSKDYMVEYYGL